MMANAGRDPIFWATLAPAPLPDAVGSVSVNYKHVTWKEN
jgi:hypothetical protein